MISEEIYSHCFKLMRSNLKGVNQIAGKLGLTFINERVEEEPENASPVCYTQSAELRDDFKPEIPRSTFSPIDILDYIFAALHATNYRKKYKDFLEIHFLTALYPKDAKIFWQMVKLGGEIRTLYLMESTKVEQSIIRYPRDGSNTILRTIDKKDWELYDIENQTGRVWINDSQYFDTIPLIIWEFSICSYYPAQKWLKDRKGTKLRTNDILLYQRIIVALSEIHKLIAKIDKIETA